MKSLHMRCSHSPWDNAQSGVELSPWGGGAEGFSKALVLAES